jgi:hypothetical membrane protein
MADIATADSCEEAISGWWQGTAKKLLVAGVIFSAVLYALGDMVAGLLYDGYSFRDQAISELTAFGSPVRPLMLTVMIVHGLPLLAFAIVLWRRADRNSLRWVGALLIAAWVVGLPNHSLWAMSSRWMETGFNDTMHQLGSMVWVLIVSVVMVLVAVAYRGRFRLYSIGTFLVFMGFGAASGVAIQGIEQNSTPWTGGFERISAYPYFVWLVLFAVLVVRRSLNGRTREALADNTEGESIQPEQSEPVLAIR